MLPLPAASAKQQYRMSFFHKDRAERGERSGARALCSAGNALEGPCFPSTARQVHGQQPKSRLHTAYCMLLLACSSQAPAATTRSVMYCSTESTRCTICKGQGPEMNRVSFVATSPFPSIGRARTAAPSARGAPSAQGRGHTRMQDTFRQCPAKMHCPRKATQHGSACAQGRARWARRLR